MNCKSKSQLCCPFNRGYLIVFSLILGLFLAAPALYAGSNKVDRHVMYGFEIPYPKELTDDLPSSRLPFMVDERLVSITIEVDAKGEVTEVSADEPFDSLFVNYYREKLKLIRFEPARVDGKKTSMSLPLILHFQPNRKLPDLFLPVDSSRTVTDRDLYFKALTLNGLKLPLLQTFPSYFCDLEWTDSLSNLPYVLLSLKLNAEGELTEVEVASTNYSAFALQLKSAALYAKFQPLYVNDRARASSCFLLVSFFPPLSYPTEVWSQSSNADYSILQRSQVQLFADTVGLLTKPLPKFSPPNDVTVPGRHSGLFDTVTASILINSKGELKALSYGKVSPHVRRGIQKLSKAIRFFPAMDYSGKARDFYGTVRFIFTGSTTIRIEYLW